MNLRGSFFSLLIYYIINARILTSINDIYEP